jgi:inhibitor of KinA
MRIFPLGDNAITIEFGNEVSLELNRKSLALAGHFDSNPFCGFIESIPAYASTTIFYDVARVREKYPLHESAFAAVSVLVENAADALSESEITTGQTIEIPTHFSDEVSLDLNELCDWSGLSNNEIIAIFLERTYNVYMIGFLPGFAYLGEVDERIAVPRKRSPRLRVPPGSVAIGGRQTGVYPLESPGGWHIIGRTDMKMFDPENVDLCPLRPGDQVKFIRA